MENVKLTDLLDVYDNEIRKNCKNKRKIYAFERNKMQNLSYILDVLSNNTYYPSKYNIFLIRDPKYRIVMSLSVVDKVVNHYLARYVLIPKLDKYLDIRTCATRENMGTSYAIKLTKRYLEKYKKYDNFYILKIDIKKYFYNIDHNVLKGLLVDKLDKDEYDILSRIIDSTNKSYVNKDIVKLKEHAISRHFNSKEQISSLPIYKYGKGLGLGAMTSQFLSIFYLYKLDHYIIHDLKLKHMIHYMDDIVIIHHDKKYLYESLSKIESFLLNECLLEINKKKTKIYDSKMGFVFLGYRFFIKNKKTVIRIRKSTLVRIKKKVKRNKYLYNNNLISFNRVFSSINTYLYSFNFASNYKVCKIIDKYFFG